MRGVRQPDFFSRDLRENTEQGSGLSCWSDLVAEPLDWTPWCCVPVAPQVDLVLQGCDVQDVLQASQSHGRYRHASEEVWEAGRP